MYCPFPLATTLEGLVRIVENSCFALGELMENALNGGRDDGVSVAAVDLLAKCLAGLFACLFTNNCGCDKLLLV